MSRITNDVDNISSTIAQTTTQLISSILTLVGSFIIMIRLNLFLTLVVLLCIPLVTLLTRVIAKEAVPTFGPVENLGALNESLRKTYWG